MNPYRYGRYRFSFKRTLVMGILNVTPDSFSDGGRFLKKSNAMKRAGELVRDGADIIDIGGESTRPGASAVAEEEESARVIPVIREIVKSFPKIPVSIDTYKPKVARAAISAGAAVLNDITGLTNPEMLEIASETGVPVVIMHMKGKPGAMPKRPVYKDVVKDIVQFFRVRIRDCKRAGVTKIILDPGIGFGKTYRHNLQIIDGIESFGKLGYPVMIGASRKSFIGLALDLPVEEREAGTLAVSAISALRGASIIRTHEVKNNRQAIKMGESIAGSKVLKK